MSAFVSDTHAVVWYLSLPNLLSRAARSLFADAEVDGGPIHVATITLVDLRYLIERQRIVEHVLTSLLAALADPSSPLTLTPLDQDIALTIARVPREQVPEMPDRIIAATALHLSLPLVTRDRRIRASVIETIW